MVKVKYVHTRRHHKKNAKLRRTKRRIPKTLKRRRHRRSGGGYSPIGPNGGNFGHPPGGYPETPSGALPDPQAVPTGVPGDY